MRVAMMSMYQIGRIHDCGGPVIDHYSDAVLHERRAFDSLSSVRNLSTNISSLNKAIIIEFILN